MDPLLMAGSDNTRGPLLAAPPEPYLLIETSLLSPSPPPPPPQPRMPGPLSQLAVSRERKFVLIRTGRVAGPALTGASGQVRTEFLSGTGTGEVSKGCHTGHPRLSLPQEVREHQ